MSEVTETAPEILRVRSMRLEVGAPAINLAIREGEIVGLAGLEGHGQEKFLQALCGLREPEEGDVLVYTRDSEGRTIQDFHEAVGAGVAYLPRDRKTEGILPPLSVLDNFGIATLDRSSRFGFLSRQAQRERLEEFRQRLSIVFSSPDEPITSLSGGNQQKVLLARWLAVEPRIMLLNDPTRGVDLPTKMTLYDVFREMATQDRITLVLLSTEIEEILQLCDRALVFRDGGMFAVLEQEAMTMSKIMAAMFGEQDGAATI